MNIRGDGAIGGYFGREAPAPTAVAAPYPAGALGYQSARAALAALFLANGAGQAWVPHFVCRAVLEALASAGVAMSRYALTATRGVPAALPARADDRIVCVDYFGLGSAACDEAIATYGPERVVVDAAQSLFHVARPGVATVYSPRKFVGVGDGGLLVASAASPPRLVAVAADEHASALRQTHLYARAAGDVEGGYPQFLAAESSLTDCTPRAMSAMTRNALDSVDWETTRTRRIANYNVLRNALGRSGAPIEPLGDGMVPLCLPLPEASPEPLRAWLISRRIYSPMYWPDSVPPVTDPVGRILRDATLYLPCDQRFDGEDMQRIAHHISTFRDRR